MKLINPKIHKIALHATSSYTAFGMAFITSLIMSRALGPEGRGEVSFLMISVSMVAAISKLGYSQWIVANGDFAAKFSVRDLLKINLWCALPLMASVAVIVIIDEAQRSLWLYFTLVTYVLLLIFNELAASLLMARLFLMRYAYLQLIQPAVALLLCCILWAFKELTVINFLYFNIVSLIVSALFSCRSLRDENLNSEGGLKSIWLLSKIKENFSVYFASAIKDITYRIEFAFVGVLLGNYELGIYSLSVMFMEIPLKLVDVVGNHLLRGTLMRIEKNLPIGFILAIVVAVTTLFCIVYIFAFHFLVPYFLGDQFSSSAAIYLLLFPACLLLALWKIFANFLIRTQKGDGYLGSVIIGLLIKIAVIMICKDDGLNAVIFAVTLGYLGMVLTLFIRSMSVHNRP